LTLPGSATLATVLTRLGTYFDLTIDDRARPIQDLYCNAGGALDALIAGHAARLRTGEPRVAASILFQDFAARIWSPVLGCLAAGLPPPDLSVDRLRWRDEPFGLSVTEHAVTTAEPAILIDEHLRPMAKSVHEATGVAEGLLWGNAASALVGTMTVLRLNAMDVDTEMVRSLLGTPPLRGAGTLDRDDPPRFRRRSCCLYYRVPGGGLCGDCCLTRVPGPATGR
jgi:FhuF 2Fe-2S C-terminal domain